MAPFTFTALLFFSLLQPTSQKSLLLHNQTIAPGQTLVSETQVFEFGFFRPGNSTNTFLGIWYKSIPATVVWVANRNNPIPDPHRPVAFSISANGTLLITTVESVIIWSANPSAAASRPTLRLLETGNLVVADESIGGSAYLWQSFDFPTDTWLSGMKLVDDRDPGVSTNLTSWRDWDDPSPGVFVAKIENDGLPEMVVYEGQRKKLRTGKWNGVSFNGLPRFRTSVSKAELVFEEERLISLAMPYESSIIIRARLDLSGSVYHYVMNPGRDKWSPVYPFPRDECDEYGHCGPNGLCTVENSQRCECFKGFVPKFADRWGARDWSGGCRRISALDCRSGDGFLEVRGVKSPDLLSYWLNASMSLDECKDECLKNCSCSACANVYITNGGTGCLMWFGDLLDTRELPATNGLQNVYVRVPLSRLDSTSGFEKKKVPVSLILISIATGFVVSTFINRALLLLARWKKRVGLKKNKEDIELPLIKMATILQATNNFSQEKVIGVGGFGPVYKGNLSGGEEIAVKRLSKASRQGLEEFKNEVVLIAKLQHRNLVRLLGCCIEGEEMMLIYEYLENKSLDRFVFDPDRRKLLTWPKRFDIIMGITRGMLYLHHDSRLKIIHRDLKTNNILLDASLNPKISDFGLARTFEEDQSISRTKRVIGTYGYMAPEYAFHGKFSVKSDVYSLGVVLLEIISGKKNNGFRHNDHLSLLGHAWMLWKEKRIMEVMDHCLKETCDESQVKRCIHVGLLCVQKLAEDRPITPSVALMLATEGMILPDPEEPGFFLEGSCRRSDPQSCTRPPTSNATVTITDLEAR
ncbi:G-type lectin S-receptor-like serine/threonine-protein kinase At4g27290 isoform X1 [Salvia splendens]|uniref:G-type lectin S-receptor-like serine/threonine-protein kinase At4g27290 isoform X1 n=1 Tax=Salvia splendens TaxID=180675 RepID=UPI001C2580B2|nr:G-type lectin S-receptor-like serine/threonine-protein kinase At4g27290 isoform X1 [Salvia splendens]